MTSTRQAVSYFVSRSSGFSVKLISCRWTRFRRFKQSTADMTVFVQNLLQQMQSRFQTMSDSIITKIDEMGNRINELEQSINDLRAEMGTEGSPSPLATSKKTDEAKPDDASA